ncbi:MAG: MBL fold metallo-hydrolase [Bacilli bacterium]|nr:MBL fold metallo-hydrolase [Bacilli bacterium]
MANKKKTAKKVVKKAKKNKFLGFLLFVIIVGFLVLGGMSYVKLNKIGKALDAVDDKFDAIPSVVDSPIEFFSPDISGVKFSWEVDKNYFPTLVELSRPSYSDGDKTTTITLKGEVELNVIDGIVDKLLNTGLSNLEWKKNIKIISLPATDLDLLNEYKDDLNLPSVVHENTSLRLSSVACDGATITWETSNPLVMTSSGEITGFGSCTLTATITKGSDVITKTFDITTKEMEDIVEVDYDFDGYSDSTYQNTDSYLDIELIGAKSGTNNAIFRVKSDSEEGLVNTKYYENIKEVKFNYSYTSSSADKDNYTKNSYVELLVSNDKENYVSLKKETLSDKNVHNFKYEFDDALSGYLQIKLTTEYGSDYFIGFDELYISRSFGSNDVIEALKKEIPTKVNKNYDFPLTSPFGGRVTYTSSNEEVLSNSGVVKEVNEPVTVTYNVVVEGFTFPVSFSVEIKVVGKSNVEPVEVRFIDLNKNGGNSDCGESTYIRIGNIDVLIDAGDNYNQTFENVKACIDTYSLDKELDYVIATHPDSDHIGGMDEVIKEYKILHLITFVENSGDTTGVFNSYKEAYTSEGCEVCKVTDSYSNNGTCKRIIELAKDVYIEIINTTFYELDANASNDNNGRSVVCVLNAYGTRILFTGDAENLGRDIESATKDAIGNIDILKVVHHGTKNGCSEEYLKVIDPEVAIICNGNYLGNKHGHPTYEAISSLYGYDSNMKVYTITGGKGGASGECEKGSSYVCSGNKDNYDFERNGMITVVIDENGYNITSENYGDNPLEIKDTNFYKEMSNAYN